MNDVTRAGILALSVRDEVKAQALTNLDRWLTGAESGRSKRLYSSSIAPSRRALRPQGRKPSKTESSAAVFRRRPICCSVRSRCAMGRTRRLSGRPTSLSRD